MAFRCPQCQANTLVITHSLELPSDGRSDEITLQLLACPECRFVATAVYEESRRGATEAWHHDGYRISQVTYDDLRKLIEQCPSPRDKNCLCQSHQQLNRVNQNGEWQRPLSLQIPSFPMRFERG
jgi:hypothetical protein